MTYLIVPNKHSPPVFRNNISSQWTNTTALWMTGSNPSVYAPPSPKHRLGSGRKWAGLDELCCKAPELLFAASGAEFLLLSRRWSWYFTVMASWHSGTPKGRRLQHKTNDKLQIPRPSKPTCAKSKGCVRRTITATSAENELTALEHINQRENKTSASRYTLVPVMHLYVCQHRDRD